jgi:hypothetical protein
MRELLLRLGYRKGTSNRWGPCPACGVEHTRNDRRPPLRLHGKGWTCSACQRGGDALTFAASHLGLASTRGSAYFRAKELVDGGVSSEPIEYPPEAPPERTDTSHVLRNLRPVSQSADPMLLAWLRARALATSIPAGVSDGATSASYWPAPMASGYRVIVPTCDGRGAVHSFQGVSWIDSSKRWPKGVDNRGLMFANKAVRAMLREQTPFATLLIVEGVIDYLTAHSLWDLPILGIFAGSDSALADIRLSDDAIVYFGTHLDAGAGLSYQDRVSSLLRHPVRRIPFEVANERPE